MLHDITKTKHGNTKANHARTGEDLLVTLGYPRTGKVVGEHIMPHARGDTLTPAEIVAYADKRVLHDRVVDLEERFDYLRERYGGHPQAREFYTKMSARMQHIEHLIEEAIQRPLSAIMDGLKDMSGPI